MGEARLNSGFTQDLDNWELAIPYQFDALTSAGAQDEDMKAFYRLSVGKESILPEDFEVGDLWGGIAREWFEDEG